MPNKFLPPSTTTTTRTAATPLDGEILYDTDEKKLYYGDGTTVGGKAIGSPTVADNVFRIQDNTDSTKQLAFEASGITTGTTRTLTVPDSNGTVLSTDTLTDKALYYYDASSKLFKPVGIGTVGQTLIAQPSSNPPYQWATSTGGRELLTANRTYYVRTDGSDSNNGLANTAGGAFLTIQKAIDVVAGLDISIYDVLIKCGNGTYTQNIILKDPVGSGNVTLEGDTTTPANVVISVSSGTCITSASEKYNVQGFRITTSGGGNGIATTKGLLKIANINFGAVGGRQLYSQTGTIHVIGNYTISGSAYNHVGVQGSGALFLMVQRTVTLTGTPAFNIFAEASVNGSMMLYQNTFSGSATGNRYYVSGNGVINVYGAGTSHLPGNATTAPATGGQYY